MIDKSILFLAGFFTLMFILARYEKQRRAEINESRKKLYETGVMVEGEVILTQSYFWTMYDVYLGVSRGSSRRLAYQFTDKNGQQYYGKDIVVDCLEPRLFFANKGHKLKVLYDFDDPTINLIYKDREKKKYKEKEK